MLDTAMTKSDDLVREVFAEVEALLAAGKPVEAISHATEANRRRPCPELEHQLMRWRMSVFDALPRDPGRTEWPPRHADPFPGLDGIPTVRANELTAELLGGAILHHGVLWVKGLINQDKAEEIRLGIEQALSARNAFYADGEERPSTWYSPVPFPHPSWRAVIEKDACIWTGDSPRMMAKLIETFEELGIIELITRHMGERPALSLAKSTLRRVPIDTNTEWHQDGAFLRRDVRAINLWLTLSPCGNDAPGLDVIPQRIPYVVQTGSHEAIFDWSVGSGVVDMLAEGGHKMASPVFEPGDAMLFDQLMLHRTGARPNLARPRWAVETWFFAPSTFPSERAPIVI